MKKRFTAIFLALALSLGLAIPAFAIDAPDTWEEAYQNVSITYTLGGGHTADYNSGTLVDKQLTLLSYDFTEDGDAVEQTDTLDSYNAIRANTEFTVTFRGTPAEDNSYIRIYMIPFVNRGNGGYEWDEWPHSRYLTHDDGFIPDYVSPEDSGGLVELKAGESVTFQLPESWTDIGEWNEATGDYDMIDRPDVVYRLRFEKWYPDTEHMEEDEWGDSYPAMQYFWRYAYFKVDEAVVDNYVNNGFTDVNSGVWYTDAVKWAVSKKITNGTSPAGFSPDDNCTHMQILTFLSRAAGVTNTSIPWVMEQALVQNWAREKGMIDDSFNGSKECTRAEAVNYIWQTLDKEDAPASSFTDVDPNASYAKAVDWAVANGVTNGDNAAQTEFSPNKVCVETRPGLCYTGEKRSSPR